MYLFRFRILFVVSLDYCILGLLTFVVLGLVSSVPSQEIGWEEHLRYDPFCQAGRKTSTQLTPSPLNAGNRVDHIQIVFSCIQDNVWTGRLLYAPTVCACYNYCNAHCSSLYSL